MYYVTVEKLKHLSSPAQPRETYRSVDDHQFFEGECPYLPEVGSRLIVDGKETKDCLVTTPVKVGHIVCNECLTGLDLPQSFPDRELIAIPSDRLKKGDYLIATENSIYWIHNISVIPTISKDLECL